MTTLQDPPVLVGSTTPRLWTPPLVTGPSGPCGCGCPLTPFTSLGFQAVEFAEGVLNVKLFSWQRYWLIHALEITPSGMFRFRTILTLISRQNGKTHLLKVLSLYLLYLGHAKLILGAAQSLDLAREAWRGAVDIAEAIPELRDEIQQVLKSTVEYSLILQSGARYRITAANDKAGRGLSVDALILDELRTHKDSAAWAALSNTTMARPNSLIIGLSNAGDDSSIVLNDLRAEALSQADPTLGLFEWSAPDGCAIDDRQGWAQANPALGYAVTEQKLMSALRTSRPQDFRTENLCQRVDALDAAIDPQGWAACGDSELSLEDVKPQVCVGVEVAYDDGHVTAMAAAPLGDGRIGLEVLDAWPSTQEARAGLRALFTRLHPRAVGWFPQGHGTVLGPDLQAMHDEGVIGSRMYLMEDDMRPECPGLVKVEQVPACEGLGDLVDNRRLVHSDDQLPNAHVAASIRKDQGDGWRFARRGAGRNDAAYAGAAAVYLARTLPPVGDYDPLESVF
jgi:hypothetical protein